MVTAAELSLEKRHPGLGRDNIPASRVISGAYFEKEKRQIFGKSWLQIATIADVAAPGAYFVKDIPTLNTSVIVTHDKDGKLHAFRNVCRHRGMKICTAGLHRGNRLNCPFHGWAFDLGGKLVGVPGEDYFYSLDKEKLSLSAVRVGVWEDLLFVNFDASGSESLEDYLGEVVDGFTGYFSSAHWERVGNYSWELPFNWKLYLDSSVEGYHAAFVHLFNNTGQVASLTPQPLWLIDDWIRLYKRHRIIGVPQNVGEREFSPAEQFAQAFGTVTAYGAAAHDFPRDINNTKSPDFAFDIMELFPNCVFFNSAHLQAIIRLWPISAGRTICEMEVNLAPAQTWAARLSQEYGRVSLRDVVREDMNTACAIQSVVDSDDEFILCDQEIAVRHSYAVIEDAVNGLL